VNCQKCGAGPEHLEVTSDKGPEDAELIELSVKCNKCGGKYTAKFGTVDIQEGTIEWKDVNE